MKYDLEHLHFLPLCLEGIHSAIDFSYPHQPPPLYDSTIMEKFMCGRFPNIIYIILIIACST